MKRKERKRKRKRKKRVVWPGVEDPIGFAA
jgi:hypothetical protein